MTDTILFVDDDLNVLAGYERQLRKEFSLETTPDAEEALEKLDDGDPFAVIVADLRMPGMDGIQFLSEVRERSPDSVRMMLTGYADLQTAIDAVNEGSIFRFLTKPCSRQMLARSLRAGLEQHRLITAEHELLRDTLTGSVKVLSEILSLVNPAAFSRGHRIRHYVRDIAARLQLRDLWQFELAAMLSQIGCVTLPPDIIDKLYNQVRLSYNEERMFSSHPSVGRKLLANIPRLEPTAQMIEGQQRSLQSYKAKGCDLDDRIVLGAQILKVVLDFDLLVIQGLSREAVLSELRWAQGDYDPRVLTAFENLQLGNVEGQVLEMELEDLAPGMFAAESLYAENGLQLAQKGQELTYPVIERLRNFDRVIGVKKPIQVWVTSSE